MFNAFILSYFVSRLSRDLYDPARGWVGLGVRFLPGERPSRIFSSIFGRFWLDFGWGTGGRRGVSIFGLGIKFNVVFKNL